MKSAMKYFACSLLIVCMFVLGYSWRDLVRGRTPNLTQLQTSLGIGQSQSKLDAVTTFKSHFLNISNGYYKKIDERELKYAGMSGMVNALGDPHTIFLEPVSAADFANDTRGTFAGIGARLGTDALGARIGEVFENGPAYAAGLRTGDIVTTVDGKSVKGLSTTDIVSIIRGPAGTNVTLGIFRANAPNPLKIRIKRAIVITPTVSARFIEGSKIGYVAVSQFTEQTGPQFLREIQKLERQGMLGLTIDLRGNPGGLLETTVDMLSHFVEGKTVVTMRMKGGIEEVARTPRGQIRRTDYPITILIDGDSASASEIFAGVMKDYSLATLVGTHSYGKGSVQNVFPLIDGSSAKITIAKYFLPSGNDVSRKNDEDGMYVSGGLSPDVEVDQEYNSRTIIGDIKTDVQLQKAVEILESKLGTRRSASNQSELTLSWVA